ncbi:MAG TPA: PepSY domain-containing protein [Thermoanaerobaculia bacterium]|nr:PepSY domain-containing protein [Thermoanaerobaculia bacterium]
MSRKISPVALIVLLMVMASRGETQLTQLFHHGKGDPLPPDPAPQASDLNADQVVARYLAARGGEQRLKGIRTVKMTGTRETDFTLPITIVIAPGRFSRRVTQGSQVALWNVVDGQTNWEINQRSGIVKPTPMPAKSAARYHRLADPQGPLVDARAKGNKIEVVGKQPLNGSPVYKLEVTSPDGAESYYYLDAKTFLPRRMVSSQYFAQVDEDYDVEVFYGDYRDVGGMKFPFKETTNAPEAHFSQTITWDKIELNQPIDDAAFRAPKS